MCYYVQAMYYRFGDNKKGTRFLPWRRGSLGTKFYHQQTHSSSTRKHIFSPVYVEEFRTGILGAGTGLASLLKDESPSADLVSAALCNVSEVVEGYSMKGKWVTSWASRANNDFLVTLCIREVSDSVPFLI